ncbi:hypothetical protein DBV15_10097 [Temnothorax longispinosus]|uniref:Uncharacterized protein n=1 Tax=Temnothorax longispinosus TaxID=300112 RepID=A0A4S2KD30_9HYME|nr:hypothetical protein DBV15_10097 [Temnothorax longispinosus]
MDVKVEIKCNFNAPRHSSEVQENEKDGGREGGDTLGRLDEASLPVIRKCLEAVMGNRVNGVGTYELREVRDNALKRPGRKNARARARPSARERTPRERKNLTYRPLVNGERELNVIRLGTPKPHRRLSPLSCSIAHDPKISPRDMIASASDPRGHLRSRAARRGGGQGPTIPLRFCRTCSRIVGGGFNRFAVMHQCIGASSRFVISARRSLDDLSALDRPCTRLIKYISDTASTVCLLRHVTARNNFGTIEPRSRSVDRFSLSRLMPSMWKLFGSYKRSETVDHDISFGGRSRIPRMKWYPLGAQSKSDYIACRTKHPCNPILEGWEASAAVQSRPTNEIRKKDLRSHAHEVPLVSSDLDKTQGCYATAECRGSIQRIVRKREESGVEELFPLARFRFLSVLNLHPVPSLSSPETNPLDLGIEEEEVSPDISRHINRDLVLISVHAISFLAKYRKSILTFFEIYRPSHGKRELLIYSFTRVPCPSHDDSFTIDHVLAKIGRESVTPTLKGSGAAVSYTFPSRWKEERVTFVSAGNDDDDDDGNVMSARGERTITRRRAAQWSPSRVPRPHSKNRSSQPVIFDVIKKRIYGDSITGAQLFQGRGALNKFIRHLTVIKDTRHAEARVIAIVLSPPLNGHTCATQTEIVFIISRRRAAEKRRVGRGRGRERSSIARTSDVVIGATTRGLILIPDDEGSPRGDARECGPVTGRSRGCWHAGLTDKHNDLMTISDVTAGAFSRPMTDRSRRGEHTLPRSSSVNTNYPPVFFIEPRSSGNRETQSSVTTMRGIPGRLDTLRSSLDPFFQELGKRSRFFLNRRIPAAPGISVSESRIRDSLKFDRALSRPPKEERADNAIIWFFEKSHVACTRTVSDINQILSRECFDYPSGDLSRLLSIEQYISPISKSDAELEIKSRIYRERSSVEDKRAITKTVSTRCRRTVINSRRSGRRSSPWAFRPSQITTFASSSLSSFSLYLSPNSLLSFNREHDVGRNTRPRYDATLRPFHRIIIMISEAIVRWRSISNSLLASPRALAAVSINSAIYARLHGFLRSGQISANAFGYRRRSLEKR